MGAPHDEPEVRFWRFASPEPNTGCWLWTGGLFKTGYGIFGFSKARRAERAHRMAWLFTKGAIPAGLDVCHSCDVRCCINPDHLYLGTRKRNMEDAVARGRTSRGEHRPLSKLTASDVIAIRASALSSNEIARVYGTSSSNIRSIRRKQRWRHV